ncbi:hypothetical protein GCM10007063_22870 [Lentibacillus kapialis]|uniref:Uncharacterized protein n=1 Tax=Lentibacillus kapialis TaxID=340214 RepID=A0A917PYR4_9BACI|nr:hypothetical protein [Lentibacillus kapialis]GGJ99921.1 hypothetical protein GCM10007063_22870 [Lentibacillus kapialis]
MELESRDSCFEANNAEDLLSALRKKETHIIIQGDYKSEFEENTQLPLTEKEQLGFNLGTRGSGGFWSEIPFQIINKLSSGKKQQKEIDSKIRKYTLKKLNEREILLYLRQLDY